MKKDQSSQVTDIFSLQSVSKTLPLVAVSQYSQLHFF